MAAATVSRRCSKPDPPEAHRHYGDTKARIRAGGVVGGGVGELLNNS